MTSDGWVVVDTPLLVSALVRPGGPAERIWRAVVAGHVRPVTSTRVLTELSEVLTARLGWHRDRVARAVRHVARHAEVLSPGELEMPTVATPTVTLAEARVRADPTLELQVLETLRAASSDDADRWRSLSAELAVVALDAGRREDAQHVARSVLRSFDTVADDELDDARRLALVAAVLVATTGQEYLTHEDSDDAYALLIRTVARLGDGPHAARLLCRAAEIVGMRPGVGWFIRPWPSVGSSDEQDDADRSSDSLLARAERLLRGAPGDDAALAATLDVAWARAHPDHEHADERRVRLDRSLRRLRGFDRAWAGTRLALDALAVGDLATLRRALVEASPTSVDRSPLVAWRVETIRAMLLLATGTPSARAAVEAAASLGERAGEPMAGVVAAVQRGVARVETDLAPLPDAELRLDGPDVHPLIRIGRLESVARLSAVRRTVTGASDPDTAATAAEHVGAVSELLDVVRSGGMNPGNQQLSAVLLARTIHHLRDVDVPAALIDSTAELLEPLGLLVPTDALGLVCAGSAARHLANLRALQGSLDEAEGLAAGARARDAALGFERFLIAGRIDAVVRARHAGMTLGPDTDGELLRCADEAERRGLPLLGREARLVANEHLWGRLGEQQLVLLEELVNGRRFVEIAERLGYSEGTVRKLALPVYRALGVGGRREAVDRALAAGLVAVLPSWPPSRSPSGQQGG